MMTYMILLHCLHPYLLPQSFVIILIMSLLTIITSNDTIIQYILPSLIAVSTFMTDEYSNSTSD